MHPKNDYPKKAISNVVIHAYKMGILFPLLIAKPTIPDRMFVRARMGKRTTLSLVTFNHTLQIHFLRL